MATRQPDEAQVSASVAAIVDRLADHGIVGAIHRRLADEIVELRGDAQLLELLGASVAGNVETVFDALRYGIAIERVEPPTAALEYARRLAQHGIPANALVRAYRLGQQVVLDQTVTEVHATDLDPALALAVVESLTALTFRYIDWISQQVVYAYEAERDRWLANRSSERAVRVLELLGTDEDVDVDAITTAIGYPLRHTHVAVILWLPESEGAGGEKLGRLEHFLRELAEHLSASHAALFVAADRVSGWGWIPLSADSGATPVATLRRFVEGRTDVPWIAIGTPGRGLAGFRRSHQQAQTARRVATAGTVTQRVIAADDPGVAAAALLSADMAQTRTWVIDTLGALAADTDGDARLRETLRVFLLEGASYKAAADRLNLHHNSVKYRVQRAVERRGRPIDKDRLDVELALLACQKFGTAVLLGED